MELGTLGFFCTGLFEKHAANLWSGRVLENSQPIRIFWNWTFESAWNLERFHLKCWFAKIQYQLLRHAYWSSWNSYHFCRLPWNPRSTRLIWDIATLWEVLLTSARQMFFNAEAILTVDLGQTGHTWTFFVGIYASTLSSSEINLRLVCKNISALTKYISVLNGYQNWRC